MRKLILSAFFVAASTASFAQNLNDVQEKIKGNKWDEAKEKLDKADAKTQATSEYWFYKAKVYSNLAKTKGDSTLWDASLDALTKYYDQEAKGKEEAKRAMLALFENHQTAYDVYNAYFQAGVKGFQSENWNGASHNFERALNAFDLLAKNKLTTATFDTTATVYAGYSAQNARRLDDAAKFYTALADRKISDSSYAGVYEFLVSYYQQKNDAANTAKYLALGKSIFPNRPSWLSYELQDLDKDKGKKLTRLAELVQQNKSNSDLWSEYAIELFNYTYANEKPADYITRLDDLTAALQGWIESNPSSAYANFVMSQHLSNQIYDLQQQYSAIKGVKPEDVKKKQDLNKNIEGKFETIFQYASKSAAEYGKMTELKPVDKANYRKMLNEVADYYTMKKQPAKAKEFSDKAKAL
jgi:hypothetical protein